MEKVIQNSHSGKVWIHESISNGVMYADICSAYIRSEAFRYFFEDLFNTEIRIRVLARWSLGDLLARASDLETYELCRSQNIDFYIKQDFHGKLYDLAPNGVLIGSFNLTNRGFSICGGGNDEAGVLIENNDDSRDYFENLYKNARLVDDEMFEKISKFVSKHKDSKPASAAWSDEFLELILPPAYPFDEKILVNECLASNFQEFINSNTAARSHDLSLLSVDKEDATDLTVIRYRFKSSKIFRWFYAALRSQEDEVYFGKATAMLHDQLFDDPKPYRQEVKGLLVNLLSWIEGLGLEEIKIDRPNHSQRITVKKEA
jgi:hypothetical protein